MFQMYLMPRRLSFQTEFKKNRSMATLKKTSARGVATCSQRVSDSETLESKNMIFGTFYNCPSGKFLDFFFV